MSEAHSSNCPSGLYAVVAIGVAPLPQRHSFPVDKIQITPLLPSRVIAGALNGTVANAKTMISEVCGKEHEVVGMSVITGRRCDRSA